MYITQHKSIQSRINSCVDSTELLDIHNVQFMFHSLVYSLTVQLALSTALMLGNFCNDIGLVPAYLLSGAMSLHYI